MAFLSTHDALTRYVSDMCGTEAHLGETLKLQLDDQGAQAIPEALEIMTRIHAVSVAHRAALDTLINKLKGTTRAALKESFSFVSGAALGLTEKLRQHSVSKMLRDDYVALNLNAVGYSMLHATGLAVSSTATAELALTHLRNTTPLIMSLSQIIIPVVIHELSTTTRIDPTVGPLALRNLQASWGAPVAPLR